MAGDSEQTLQNHQQPNGGEPFLIGVSGGTASGKVRRGRGAALRGPGGGACGAAAGRVSCCSHRVARAPPLLAALQRPVFPAPTAGRAGGRAGGGSGPRGARGGGCRRPPVAGLARSRSLFFSAAVTRGSARMGAPAGKAGRTVLRGSDGGGEGLRHGRRRAPGAPPTPPSPARRSRGPGAGRAGEPDPAGCENARGGVPGPGAGRGPGIAGLSGENPERRLGAVTSTECSSPGLLVFHGSERKRGRLQ